MTNLFIVQSPLQLINATEARYRFSRAHEKNYLVILEGVSVKNLEQIRSLVKTVDWDEILILNDTDKRWSYRVPIKRLNILLDRVGDVSTVFIGEYRSILMRHLAHSSKSKKVYLLDDGNYSLFLQQKLLEKIGVYNSYNIVRKAYDRILGISDRDLFDIHFFSVYDQNIHNGNEHRFVRNDYRHLKKELSSKKFKNEVYFLGNITPELHIFTEEYYLRTLKAALDYYHDQGLNVIYIPHRRESQIKLKTIKSHTQVEVRTYDLPIEQVLLKSIDIPFKIASFFSSALDNCYYLLGGNLMIEAFSVHEEEIKVDEYIERIRLNYSTYRSYDRNSFKIIELKEYLI